MVSVNIVLVKSYVDATLVYVNNTLTRSLGPDSI